MNDRDRVHLQRCLELARLTLPVAGARIAATLIWKGYSFVGYNSKKTHPLMAKWGKNDKAICLHAEVDAIKNAMRRLHPDNLESYPATMYVARAKADGSVGMAKPCSGCARCLAAFNVEKVIWTEDESTYD